jgi:hypothetical protein
MQLLPVSITFRLAQKYIKTVKHIAAKKTYGNYSSMALSRKERTSPPPLGHLITANHTFDQLSLEKYDVFIYYYLNRTIP